MTFDTSIKQGFSRLRQQDRWWGYLCFILLMIAAFVLHTVNLGGLPLHNPEENATAYLANKILQAPPHSWRWIFPTVLGNPDRLQPPLFPDLVALSYKLGGFSSLTTRLPSALLGTLSTAILYGIGRELFKVTPPALLACCVYLTSFPVIAQGRLGTINSPLLCFEMFALWAILRSRRDLRWTLLAGFGLCLVGLSHNWSFVALSVLILLFLRIDTPRLLFSAYFYFGLFLGMMPLIAWWLAQFYYYDSTIDVSAYFRLSNLNLEAITSFNFALNPLSYRSFVRYLELSLSYGSPWLIVALYGLRLAWNHQTWGWAKFILIVSSVSASFLIFAIAINDWNLLPIYPVLALAAGMQLYQLKNLPSYIDYPRFWLSVFNCSALVFCLLGLYGKFILEIDFSFLLLVIFGSTILTLIVAAFLLARRDVQFIYILVWGGYISLLLFFVSPYWV